MSKPFLIGIYSSMHGSGKTTFAKLLTDELGKKTEIESFSRPMKEIAEYIVTQHFKVPDFCAENKSLCLLYPDGTQIRQNNGEPLDLRKMYQTIGTEWGRMSIHPDIWVQLALARVAASKKQYIIFDDMRFDNEYYAIKAARGLTIRIIKTTKTTDPHISEGQLDDRCFGETIENTGEWSAYKKSAKEVAERITLLAILADARAHIHEGK